jgi:hypothetical protein
VTRSLYLSCCLLLGVLLQIASAYAQVAPAPSLYNPNLWYGQNSSPPCVLTNGSVIAVNALFCTKSPGGDGVDLNTITLTQNSTFAFPTGLPVKGNFKFGFRINHSGAGGPYTAQFAPGYQFPNAVLTNGQPTLSTSGTDYVWCVSQEGSSPTAVDCTASMLAMTGVTVPPAYSIVAHNIGSNCGNASTCAGTSVTYTSTTNQLAFVAVGYCDTGSSSCANAAVGVTVSSVTQTAGTATSTCARATGVAGVTDSVDHLTQDIFICTPTALGASSTATYTATMSGTAHGPTVATVIVSGVTTTSPDDGIGKAAAGTIAPSVTTTATTTQGSEFLFSTAVAGGGSSTPPTVGTGYTQIDSSGIFLTQWAVSGSSGSTQTATAVATGDTGSTVTVIGVKHP